MLRVIRNHKRAADGEAAGYEQLSVAPTPLDHASLTKAGPAFAASWRGGAGGLERGAGARRGARVPQRAGLRRRPDRHDRPRHGLRHDRHRARLRPGQVQEARRRRLFQDHQPRRARRLARARLRREGDRGHRSPTPSAGRRSPMRRAINHSALRAKGLPEAAIDKVEAALARRLRHPLRLQQVDARGRDLERGAEDPGRALRGAGLRPPLGARLLQGRDRGRQHLRLRRHDLGGRASSEARALSGVRLRQSVRPHGQALSLGREPHPHDGGGAAVHHRRDLEDHQHAERRHRRGLQGRLHALLAARPQGERALPRRLETVAAA